MAHRARSHTDAGRAASNRSTAYLGLGFVLLLLVSAGMVTVPGDREGVAFVRDFYRDNGGVIATAQVIGLVAAGAFLGFARGLQRGDVVVGGGGPWILASGFAVAGAAVLTAVPPLLLLVAARSWEANTVSSLAMASDLADVALFTSIAAFALAVAASVKSTWVRAVSAVVIPLSMVRAALLLAGSETLELVAPMTFIGLVLCLAWSCWRRQDPSSS